MLADAHVRKRAGEKLAIFWRTLRDIAEHHGIAGIPADAARLSARYRPIGAYSGAPQVRGDSAEGARITLDQTQAARPLSGGAALASQPASGPSSGELLNSYERLAFVAGEPDR